MIFHARVHFVLHAWHPSHISSFTLCAETRNVDTRTRISVRTHAMWERALAAGGRALRRRLRPSRRSASLAMQCRPGRFNGAVDVRNAGGRTPRGECDVSPRAIFHGIHEHAQANTYHARIRFAAGGRALHRHLSWARDEMMYSHIGDELTYSHILGTGGRALHRRLRAGAARQHVET